MARQVDNRGNEGKPGIDQASSVSGETLNALNRMRAVCGIVGRVALRSIEEREQESMAREGYGGKARAGKRKSAAAGVRSCQAYPDDLSVEELFAQAISTLGLSKDEVIDLWDLFLAASAGAKKHYRQLIEEQRQRQHASKGDLSAHDPAVHVVVPYESQ